jgi:hypothetical protein
MTPASKLKSLCHQLSNLLEPGGGVVEVSDAERKEVLKAAVEAQWVLAIQVSNLVK